MKKLVLLFTALLVVGCGEKSSSEGSDSVGESTGPSSDAAKQVPTESPGKGVEEIEVPGEFLEIDWGSGGSSKPGPPSLSDADVERLLKEAVDMESLEERDGLIYQDNTPYSGWVKAMHNSEQVAILAQAKDGKPDGPHTMWHENGQKQVEATWKDGEEVSAKYWNSKGEEVETVEEAFE